MNPVAAGGVVALAWYREEDGREVPLIRASDLEACQQAAVAIETECREAWKQAAHWREQLTAAQAEADRLRELLGKELRWRLEDIRERLMVYGFNGERLYGIDEWSEPAVNLQLAIDLIDTAIHAAKTEQERGE